MTRAVRPLTPDDLPELSQFLTEGFHLPGAADFATTDVLRWKYLPGDTVPDFKRGSLGSEGPLSYLARDASGRIIGHLGLCRTAFEGRALNSQGGPIPTIHIIDWLGSPAHRAVGISLMRKAHEESATQFGLGVSQAALIVGERIGYELRSSVPVYTCMLRTSYWLRTAGLSPFQRCLRLARDTMCQRTRPPGKPRVALSVKRVSQFGAEVYPIIEQAKAHAILTERNPRRLNTMLSFPRQAMTGWHILDEAGQLCGFALLNVIPNNTAKTRTGKIVDCLLGGIDVAIWQAAIIALTRVLNDQGADLAMAYGSNPWTTEALFKSGFESRFAVKFHIRDRNHLIPREAIFHLTPLEGDYAYT